MAESAYAMRAKNISLLHLMHKIPEPPSVNNEPSVCHDKRRYALSFATERSVAGALAFISSITDSPNCITAVCVQEQPGGGELKVHVAINKGNYKDNNATLEMVCRGLNQPFARLRSPDDSCEGDIFKQIVSMCRPRILCRFGYEKKTNSKCRNPFDTALDRARHSLLQLQSGVQVARMQDYRQKAAAMRVHIQEFIDRSAKLLKIVRSWQLHQTDGELCAVVDGLCDFVASNEWRAVLELIPDSLMDPSLRRSLVTMLKKGAKYRQAARVLYRAAKKHPVARRMEAVAIHLAEPTFQRPPIASPLESLDEISNRILANQKHDFGSLCRVLNTNPAAARAAFDAQRRKTLTEGKFHAEVQLLHQILENPSPTPPRVVCASKDACYLCHCLLRAHAKLDTPRCHGRLYPGWRLPPTPVFRSLQVSLNRILEEQIRYSAGALLKNNGRRRHVYPQPCESTCSTAMLSDTTVVGNETYPRDNGTVEQEVAYFEVAEDSPLSLETAPSPRSTQDGPQPVATDVSSHHKTPSLCESYALAQGQVVTATLSANTLSSMYTADALQMQLEYTARERPETFQRDRRLQYRVQQLTSRESRTLRKSDDDIPIVDVSLLATAEEHTYKLHEQAELYLGAGDCVFRLTLQPALQA